MFEDSLTANEKTGLSENDDLDRLTAQFGEALKPLIERFGYEGIEAIGRLIAHLIQEDRQKALYLLKKSPSIISRLLPYGEEMVLKVYQLGEKMIPWGSMVAITFLEMSPAILGPGNFDLLAQTADLAGLVARTHGGTAVKFIEVSPYILETIGVEGLEKVGNFSAYIARSSWTYAIKALENSPAIIQRLLTCTNKGLIITIYDLAWRTADENWNFGLDLVEDSPSTAEKLASLGQVDLLPRLYRQAEKALPFGAQLVFTLINRAPSLIGRLGPEGLETVWHCALIMAADNPENAQNLLKKSDQIITGLQACLEAGQIEDLYVQAGDLARFGSSLALRFFINSGALCTRLDDQKIQDLLVLIQEMAKTSQKVAEAFIDVAPALIDRLGTEGPQKIAHLVTPLAREQWETASRFLLKSPELIDRLGWEGLTVVHDFTSLLAKESWSSAVQLLDKCPHIIDGLVEFGDLSLISKVCHLGGRMARLNARLAVGLLETSPELLRLAGFAGLERLEELAFQTGLESWTTAVSLVAASPRLIERMGFEGLEQIRTLAVIMARENSYGAVGLLEKSPDWIDRLTVFGDTALVLRVFKLAEGLAQVNWRLPTALLEKSPDMIGRIGLKGLEDWVGLIQQTAGSNSQCAGRLLDLSPGLIDQVGLEGLETIAEFVAVMARQEAGAALTLLEKTPLLIERLGNSGDRTIIPAIFDLAAKVAVTSPAAALRLLEKSPEFVQWVGFQGFGMIAAFIQDTASRDEEKALAMLSGDSPAFADFMENIPKGLELKTIKTILANYLKALLGRRVEIDQAESVYTDGRKIYLPPRVKEFLDPKDNFIFYKVSATHQEAHLEYGSFEFDLNLIKDSIETVKELYGTKVAEDGSDMDRFIQLFPEPDLARDLFNLIEDFRIETILKREYAALGAEITRMNAHQLSKRRSPKKMTNLKQRLMEMITQALIMGQDVKDTADPVFPVLQKALKLVEPLGRTDSSVHDSARITVQLVPAIDKQFKDSYRPVNPLNKSLDQDMVTQNIGSFGKTSQQIQDRMEGRPPVGRNRPLSQPEAESGSEAETQPSQSRPNQENIQPQAHRTGRDQRTFQGPTGGEKPESGDDEPDTEETGRVGESMKFDSKEQIERLLKALYREKGITPKEIGERLESLRQNEIYLFLHNLEAMVEKKTELEREKGTYLYPEWGEDIHDYRNNWARIREQTLPGRSLSFYRETLDKYAGLLKKIRREFQMLKPEEFTRLKRQVDGDDIDLDAFVDYLVDRKVGLSPNENNYSLNRKKRRDIAVAFLIDMSRSTKGVTITLEKESLVIMSEALHEVGDAFAVFGFSGDNRDNVDFYRIKDFDDPYNDQVKKRISAIEERFENRDGTAIRHAIHKLRKRAERTKMIILLSDGKPVDKDYSGPYAIEDTRLALKEAQHLGMKTFCITVDRAAAEYLPRMYSHSSWTVIDDVGKLPEKITRIYRMLTA